MHDNLLSNVFLLKNVPQCGQDLWSLLFDVFNGNIFLRIYDLDIEYALLCYNNKIYMLVDFIVKLIKIHMEIGSVQINFTSEMLFYVDTIPLGQFCHLVIHPSC